MTKWILRSRRKPTGGLIHKRSKKHKHQRARDFLPTHVGEPVVRSLRVRGGGNKRMALRVNTANITSSGKGQKTKILSVVENKADTQFVRRNIITRGAIIQTELGTARVTSRPGQEGVVNAILVEHKVVSKKK